MLNIEKIENREIRNKYIKFQNLCSHRPLLNQGFNDLLKMADEDYEDDDLECLLEYFVATLVPLTTDDNTALYFYSIIFDDDVEEIKKHVEEAAGDIGACIEISYVNPNVLEKVSYTLVKDYITFDDDYMNSVVTDGTVSLVCKTKYYGIFAKLECTIKNASIIWMNQYYGGDIVNASAIVDATKDFSVEEVMLKGTHLKEYTASDFYTKSEKVKSLLNFRKN